jgi:hypothetical protein
MNKFTCILLLFVAAPAFGQDVPPPPKPADGPTLEVTTKYIQDRLNGEGKVSSQVTYLLTSEEKADGRADTPGVIVSHNTVTV